MDVSVSGRHMTVSDRLRTQTEEKIGRLDRYLGMERAEVHFWEERNARRVEREFCEVTLVGHGHHVRAKVAAADGYTAIDLAVDKLERQLRKLKTKLDRSRTRDRPHLGEDLVPDHLVREAAGLVPADGPQAEASAPEPIYRIVKSKRFELTLLHPQEAALKMDLLNHDFFVFTNAETERAAVLYRRDDGHMGLIDAE
ncbi:MAG: ribosome hibernation-promoting factor, HPF/YfiA family [Acidimicrobiales bacterium]